jgi:hypothetical protein
VGQSGDGLGGPGGIVVVITIHWSTWTVEYRRNSVHWAEYSFGPLPELTRSESARHRCFRRASEAVDIEVPRGSRMVRDSAGQERLAVKDLVRNYTHGGMDPETAARCAHFGRHGFSYAKEGGRMTKRQKPAALVLPGLDLLDEPAGPGAYGQAASSTAGVPDDSIVSELVRLGPKPDARAVDSLPFEERARAVALEVVRQARADARAEMGRQFERMETAIRRAVEELSRPVPQSMHALAILRECTIPETVKAESA